MRNSLGDGDEALEQVSQRSCECPIPISERTQEVLQNFSGPGWMGLRVTWSKKKVSLPTTEELELHDLGGLFQSKSVLVPMIP